jgi:hypothetical protein
VIDVAGNNTTPLGGRAALVDVLTEYVNKNASISVETRALAMLAKKIDAKRLWVVVKYTLS